MKRRDFLKLLGVAVVAPGTVAATVKAKPQQMWLSGNKGSCISGEQAKNGIRGDRWKVYYIEHPSLTKKEHKEFIKKFRKAHKNTKFQKPIPYGIPYWVGLRT